MIRLLILIAFIFLLALGFSWLADHPGTITVTWLEEEVQVPLLQGTIVLFILIAVLMVIWAVVSAIWRSPGSLRRFFWPPPPGQGLSGPVLPR